MVDGCMPKSHPSNPFSYAPSNACNTDMLMQLQAVCGGKLPIMRLAYSINEKLTFDNRHYYPRLED